MVYRIIFRYHTLWIVISRPRQPRRQDLPIAKQGTIGRRYRSSRISRYEDIAARVSQMIVCFATYSLTRNYRENRSLRIIVCHFEGFAPSTSGKERLFQGFTHKIRNFCSNHYFRIIFRSYNFRVAKKPNRNLETGTIGTVCPETERGAGTLGTIFRNRNSNRPSM